MDTGMTQPSAAGESAGAASDLPAHERPSVGALLGRAARRACPRCGAGRIFRSWFTLAERCPRCAYRFEREEGYFLGAYLINLVVAELIGIGFTVYLLVATDLSTIAMQAAAVAAVIGLPLLFFPYSRTFWMAIDLMMHPAAGERSIEGGSHPGEGNRRPTR